MRIWIINHYADPPDGMATRSFDISRRWAQSGHETTLFTSNFNHYRFRNLRPLPWLALWADERISGVRFVWVRTVHYRRNDWRRVANMASFSAAAILAGLFRRPRPDVVIGVSVHPLAALSGYVLAVVRRAEFHFEVTDLWPQTLIDLGELSHDSLTARAMRALERFLYRRAKRIIMLWRHTDDYVRSLGVDASKIVWVPHGVELDRYESLVPYDGGTHRPFRIMYLGSFVHSMDLPNILRAARVLQERGREDVRFLLVGSGTYRDEIMQQAQALGLRNVGFPQPVPKHEVASVMNDADAFIYGHHDVPLYRFGQSLNKLADYLAGGRPILYYGTSSYDPVSQAGAGLTVAPGDPEALADAVERLLGLSPEERLEMGQRGRAHLMENHHIPRLAERLMAELAAG